MSKSDKLSLSQSQEDYLESIYVLMCEGGVARSRDISKRLNVNTSSVTGALKSLSSLELINYEPYGTVTLTAKGQKLAKDIAARHKMLRNFFESVLSVDRDEADRAACYMEHSGSSQVVQKLGQFAEFVKSCGDDGRQWLENFNKFCQQDDMDSRIEVK